MPFLTDLLVTIERPAFLPLNAELYEDLNQLVDVKLSEPSSSWTSGNLVRKRVFWVSYDDSSRARDDSSGLERRAATIVIKKSEIRMFSKILILTIITNNIKALESDQPIQL